MNRKNLLIKVTLTVLLIWWVVLPFFTDKTNRSILAEIYRLGTITSLLLIGSFFVMVAFYCRTLQKCLALIKPENRKANPKSVWYTFALPFNFIEVFFIVINIANSIEEEKKSNTKLNRINDFGMVSGIGWSVAQVMSFIPNIVGLVAGLIGMILVIHYWILINRITKILE